MAIIDTNISLAETAEEVKELKIEIDGKITVLRNVLVSKNITVADGDTLTILIQKVDENFTLNKAEIESGKTAIATSITNKGVSTTASETLEGLATKIDQIDMGAKFS